MTKTEQNIIDCKKMYPYLIAHLKKEVSSLSNTIGSTSDIDIRTYPLVVVAKLTKMFSTLWNVINIDEDYFVSNIIIRSIADNISSLLLIYDQNDGDIRFLRHSLFLLDGICNRLSNLIKPIKNEDVSEEEYLSSINQQENFKNNLHGAKEHILNQIKNLDIYQTHKENIDILIKNHFNWKFKNFEVTANKINDKNNTYKWKNMYELLNMKELEKFFSSYQSDYVHGLSMSNVYIETNEQNMGVLICFAVALLGRIDKFLHRYYKDYLQVV